MKIAGKPPGFSNGRLPVHQRQKISEEPSTDAIIGTGEIQRRYLEKQVLKNNFR